MNIEPEHDAELEAMFRDIVEPEEIDRRPPCECKCDSGAGMHSDRRCGQRATHLVALHRWGFCTDPPDTEGYRKPENVDTDGNICAVMCPRCANNAERVAQNNIRQMLATMPAGVIPPCPTCGRPTEKAEDICETRPIYE